jgi:hypothetical protein
MNDRSFDHVVAGERRASVAFDTVFGYEVKDESVEPP